MSTDTTTPSFFTKALSSAIAWLKKEFGTAEKTVQSIEYSIAKFADAVVNEYKVLAANPEIKLLADWFIKIAEDIDPALTPLISGIELVFPKIVSISTGVVAETQKPIEQQLGDGLTALENLKGIKGTYYANVLGGINTEVQNYVISNNATELPAVTDAQLITTAQAIHAS